MYRLLADILNDSALVLDTVSPVLNSYFAWPQLRIAALCLSASSRALCGIVAGGSKAAISLHFASPEKGKGDIGDLNAKDASKETVLALFGMVVGSFLVPRLTTLFSTYFTLFVLIGLHIALNYMGVKALALRTMNHHRLWISWFLYDEAYHPTSVPTISSSDEPTPPSTKSGSSSDKDKVKHTFTPEKVNALEPLFAPDIFTTYRDPITHRVLGHVTLGSSLSQVLDRPLHPEVIASLQHADCVIWFDKKCLIYEDDPNDEDQDSEPTSPYLRPDVVPHVHVCYKDIDRCSKRSRVRAWIAAGLLCKAITHLQDRIRLTKSDYKIETEKLLRTKSNDSAGDEWAISPVVPNLLAEISRGSYIGEYQPGWSNFRKKGLDLGWAFRDDGAKKSSYSSRDSAEVDDGEDGLVMPEPKYVLSGLGYSYETKKDA
ncbi:hypothetical protein EST38_g3874 [Candolleomyces aberdarensis]|uniref:Protein root UVB sensitive/RUS domain-containing protein n=1 Tax=Candolleomyces aberdarensis TaxID=2316362 RepID=A0A4Q2DR20_9AGAR|nr:hypothetical protein EST38_g3874 [Candolleomyces aberdarensis]